MAAIFYKYKGDGIFKISTGAQASPMVSDLFKDLVTPTNLMILSQVTATINETIQYFLTFDDFIHYFHFGKGLGSVNMQGTIFSSCSGDFPGLKALWERVGKFRGKEIKVSFGTITMTGILQTASFTMVADPETMINFSIDLGIINSSLPSPKVSPSC
jgi:hypothetical protein